MFQFGNLQLFTGLKGVNQRSLRSDALAGLAIWAVLTPSAIVYAGIVKVDPVIGLYTVAPALVAYAIFGTSRTMVVGADGALAALVGSTAATLGVGDADRFAAVGAVSILVGVIYLLLRTFRLGWLGDLVPRPVLGGFILGLVVATVLNQIPVLAGVTITDPSKSPLVRVGQTFAALADAHGPTILLGIGSLVVMLAMHYAVPRLPSPLVSIGFSIIAYALFDLGNHGVEAVGRPSGHLDQVGFPSTLTTTQWVSLVPGALAVAVLGFTESIATVAETTEEELDPDDELLALGVANAAVGFFAGFAVSGSITKTRAAIVSGATSQFANLVVAVLGVLTLLFLGGLFDYLAYSVLAANAIGMMVTMINVRYMMRLARNHQQEFVVFVVAFMGVAFFGILVGVGAASLLSLAYVVRLVSQPQLTVLEPDSKGRWRAAKDPKAPTGPPGLRVVRFEGPMLYLNARSFRRTTTRIAQAQGVNVVIFHGAGVTIVDSTSADAWGALGKRLKDMGVDLWVSAPTGALWNHLCTLAATGRGELPPAFATMADAVAAYEKGFKGGKVVDQSAIDVRSTKTPQYEPDYSERVVNRR